MAATCGHIKYGCRQLKIKYNTAYNSHLFIKALEKAAHTQITAYLENKSLIPEYQSAYLKTHSCETALFQFTNDVQQMLSENKAVILVQLDLSAAFDTRSFCSS